MQEGWSGGILWEFRMVRYTLLYLKWITNKDLLYSTWNFAQCYMAALTGGEKNIIYIYTQLYIYM